jgi:hypothetical protein
MNYNTETNKLKFNNKYQLNDKVRIFKHSSALDTTFNNSLLGVIVAVRILHYNINYDVQTEKELIQCIPQTLIFKLI